MKNTLGRLWKFANTPVEKIFSWDTVKGGADSAKAIFGLAKTLDNLYQKAQKQKSAGTTSEQNKQIIQLVDKTSTLLDVLNSPWGQVISSSLPFVSIGVNLLKFYLEITKEEPPLSQSVALVTQSAYLASLQNYLQKNTALAEKLQSNKEEASEVVSKEIDKLADLELTDSQARFALVYFPESKLATAFNDVLSSRLAETGIKTAAEASIIAQNIASNTPRYIEEALAEGAESIEKIRKWYYLGGKGVFEKYLNIDIYLEETIATLPQQKVFDEEFTFQDIYVPLKAIPLDANGEEIYGSQSFVLQDWTKKKIVDEEYKNKVIVIQAGPGRGKSVFCRMFAEQIRQELHPRLTPIFIRLRDIETFENNFEQTLKTVLSNRDFVTTDDGWLTDRNTHYLFFLDGFDELRLEVINK